MKLEFENEIWKDIKGYEGLYKISNYGNVCSVDRKTNTRLKNQEYVIKKGKPITPHLSKGYYSISLSKGNKTITQKIHRLVAQAFIPNPLNKPQINHINGIKTDNRAENLEWCNCKENIQHAFKTGLKPNNVNSVKAMNKASKKPIIQIKNGYVVGKYESLVQAEKTTNVKAKNISSVLNGRSKTAGGYEWKVMKGEK